MSQSKIYRGIASAKTQKGLVEFSNKLQMAGVEEFSNVLHEKSKIGIQVQDYSKGTGEKNVIVEANISPEEAQGLLDKAKAIFYFGCKGEFSKSWTEIFGEYVDEDGKKDGSSIVHKLWITRTPVDSKGQKMNYPWCISIENGKGKKAESSNSIVPNTYVCVKKAKKQVSDEDFIRMLRRVDTCIREFEGRAAGILFDEAYKRLQLEKEAREAQRAGVGK